MKLTSFLKNPIVCALAVCLIAGLLTATVASGVVPFPDDSAYYSESRAPMVDLNEATVSELTVLDGIGYTRALAIVAYREENGAFERIRDIMNVPGIGEGIFHAIRNQIYV